MKLLFVTGRFPYPPLKGDQVVPYHRMRVLSQRHEITLLTCYEKEEDLQGLEHLRPYCHAIHLVKLPKWRSLFNMGIRAPLTSLPLQVLYFHSAALRNQLNELLCRESFDLVHAFMLRIAPALAQVEIPVVLDLNDSMQLNLERRIALEAPPKRWIFQEELRRMVSYERMVGQRFPHMIVVSEIDKTYISNSDSVHAIPLGVDTERFSSTGPLASEPTLLFTGNMSYAPNIDAVTWFVNRCFPHILESVPGVRLIVAGANPPPEILAMQSDRISVTGFVTSIGEVMRQGRVAIAPMQSGSGMQFKILEAMACGLPVVTTSLGLGSIKAQVGKEVLVADEADAFADIVVSLLQNSEDAQNIARQGQAFVLRNHSWEHAAEQVESVYRLAVAGKNR